MKTMPGKALNNCFIQAGRSGKVINIITTDIQFTIETIKLLLQPLIIIRVFGIDTLIVYMFEKSIDLFILDRGFFTKIFHIFQHLFPESVILIYSPADP